MYKRKTEDEWEIQSCYQGLWSGECICSSAREARETAKTYRANVDMPIRIVYRRLPKEVEVWEVQALNGDHWDTEDRYSSSEEAEARAEFYRANLTVPIRVIIRKVPRKTTLSKVY